MKNSTLLLAASSALVSSLAVASAQDSSWDVSGNVAFTSDYRFRGVSLSDNSFAVQGGFDAAHASGFYAGTWASSLDGDSGVPTELDLYAGYGWTTADGVSFDIGLLGYFYPDAAPDDFDYYEPYASVGTTIGGADLGLGVAYAPEQNALDDDNIYFYSSADFALSPAVGLSLGLGYEDGPFGDEKLDYSVGVGTSASGLDVSVAFIGFTQEDDDGFEGSDETVVLTVGKSL
ncbi:hypothetical protein PB2503_11464 [Parvularcula bermudensis HTCC2503]|uniref:Uncharacterized protein n=1 Tax=Parvularcula bermudensis (strain ATCC BAA-594 / HTCC2503 / KCTC 12087) TaxID=314260 RepID=E0TCV5_PARBH|nr:TorF family putative porin [Parvularcula bermudensis]ADM10338.1 hypothetical protein PB2503_11464 [Parvularcula bermudensis HTCC2503]